MGLLSSFGGIGKFNHERQLFQITATNNGMAGLNGQIIRMWGNADYNTSWRSWYPGYSDFCVESWIKIDSGSSTISTFFTLGGDGTLQNGDIGIGFSSTSPTYGTDPNHWVLQGSVKRVTTGNYIFNENTDPLSADCFISPNTWTHVAMTRHSNTVDLWVNGKKSHSYWFIDPIEIAPESTQTMIGMFGSQAFNQYTDGGSAPWNYTGKFRNVRYVVGNCVYLNEFTPPDIMQPQSFIDGTYFKMEPHPVSGDYSFDASNNYQGISFVNEIPNTNNYVINVGSGRADGSGAGTTPGMELFQ